MHIAISGAGLAGLALARSLLGSRHSFVLFEPSKRPPIAGSEHGRPSLGLGIEAATGLQALRRLGIDVAEGSSLAEHSQPIGSLHFRDGHDAVLFDLRLPVEPPALWGVKRSPLQQALLAEVPREAVLWGRGVESFEERADGVHITTTAGDHVVADVLCGADGIRSAVRRRLVGDELHSLGVWCIAGVSTANGFEQDPHASWLFLHDRVSVFVLPLDASGTRLWSCGVLERPTGDLQSFAAHHTGSFPASVRQLVGASSSAAAVALADRAPIGPCSTRRVVLLGDAAHPMSPFCGKGGNLALLDGVELGAVLTELVHPSREALRSFEQRMQARAHGPQLESRRAADDYHASDACARLAHMRGS